MQVMPYGMMEGWGFPALIFWILGTAGLVLLIKHFWECRTAAREESALEILKKRYAKGEISKEEFEEKKKDLV